MLTSGVSFLAYFLCSLCKTYPLIYCSPAFSLSDNTMWDAGLSSVGDIIFLQYVSILLATLVASKVAEFRESPWKKFAAFNGTCA